MFIVKKLYYRLALAYARWRVHQYLKHDPFAPVYSVRYVSEGPNRCVSLQNGLPPVVMIRVTPISVQSLFSNRVTCAHKFTSVVDRFSFALLHEIRHAYQQQRGVLTHTVYQEPRDGSLFVHLKWKDDFHLVRKIDYTGEIQSLTEGEYVEYPWEVDANAYATRHLMRIKGI